MTLARLVGRENVIAGADCGFSSRAIYKPEVHPTRRVGQVRGAGRGRAARDRAALVSADELVERALAWVAEVHPHARHFERTRDWLLVLDPDAGEALRDRRGDPRHRARLPGRRRPVRPQGDPGRPRATRSGTSDAPPRSPSAGCASRAPPRSSRAASARSSRVHEWGGSPRADLLQAADSLSFLEIQVDLFIGMVRRRAPDARARRAEAAPHAWSGSASRARGQSWGRSRLAAALVASSNAAVTTRPRRAPCVPTSWRASTAHPALTEVAVPAVGRQRGARPGPASLGQPDRRRDRRRRGPQLDGLRVPGDARARPGGDRWSASAGRP